MYFGKLHLSEVELLPVTAFWEWFPIWWSQLGRLSPQQCIQRAKGHSRSSQSPRGKAVLAESLASRLEPFKWILHTVLRLPLPTGRHPNSLTRFDTHDWPLRLFGRFCSLPPAICLGHLSCPHPEHLHQRARTESLSPPLLSPSPRVEPSTPEECSKY